MWPFYALVKIFSVHLIENEERNHSSEVDMKLTSVKINHHDHTQQVSIRLTVFFKLQKRTIFGINYQAMHAGKSIHTVV